MKEEIDSLNKNKTWILVVKTEFRKVIGCKWVSHRVNTKQDLRLKASNQEEGINFNEVFSQ